MTALSGGEFGAVERVQIGVVVGKVDPLKQVRRNWFRRQHGEIRVGEFRECLRKQTTRPDVVQVVTPAAAKAAPLRNHLVVALALG